MIFSGDACIRFEGYNIAWIDKLYAVSVVNKYFWGRDIRIHSALDKTNNLALKGIGIEVVFIVIYY